MHLRHGRPYRMRAYQNSGDYITNEQGQPECTGKQSTQQARHDDQYSADAIPMNRRSLSFHLLTNLHLLTQLSKYHNS